MPFQRTYAAEPGILPGGLSAEAAGYVDFCPSIPAGTKFSKMAQLCFAARQGWLVQNPTTVVQYYCEVDYRISTRSD